MGIVVGRRGPILTQFGQGACRPLWSFRKYYDSLSLKACNVRLYVLRRSIYAIKLICKPYQNCQIFLEILGRNSQSNSQAKFFKKMIFFVN